MVGGRALGVVITASLVGILAQYAGWQYVFWSLAVFTLLPMPLVLGIKEADRLKNAPSTGAHSRHSGKKLSWHYQA